MPPQDLADRQELGASMVEEIRRTAQRRLRQIEPLIEEAERLRDVLEALERRPAGSRAAQGSGARPGNSSEGNATRTSRKSGAGTGRGAKAQARTPQPRAPRGANKRIIIELVSHSPGITPAEISAATGVKRTVIASTVSRLKRHGELRDYEHGGLCLPSSEDTPTARATGKHSIDSPQPDSFGKPPRRLASLPRRRAA